MEKIIAGSVILFREICPKCKEYNLSGEMQFTCDCGERYIASELNSERKLIDGKIRRKNMSKIRKEIIESQGGKCYWCGRKFGVYYIKNGIIRTLKAVVDHIMPYGYGEDNSDKNLCASCNICNAWKSSLIFETEDDCRMYLGYKMDKSIKNGKIIICEEEYEKELTLADIKNPI